MKKNQILKAKKIGIDTYKEHILYVRENNVICSSEGFEVHVRVRVTYKDRFILATINVVTSDLLQNNEVGLSNYAWEALQLTDNSEILISHPKPLPSLSYVRSKVYGHELSDEHISAIIRDIGQGLYSDLYITTFLTACANGRLNQNEITAITKSMIDMGQKLTWNSDIVVDKHCVGGLPGNRTTLVVVPIVAAFGLYIPKTSSRAITSPAGTADTMEVLAPVNLNLQAMKKVVENEYGCIVWGGAVTLSPVDDILIRVEKAIDLDSEGQVIASILSKKYSAGSTHVLLDIPIGATAKIRSRETAEKLKNNIEYVSDRLGLKMKVIFTDGRQPIGQGIGPALEAEDVVAVLKNEKKQPYDLREKSIAMAGKILEFSAKVKPGDGKRIATEIVDSGKAWNKFQSICDAQGGMKDIPKAKYNFTVEAFSAGRVYGVDNRKISRIAKLAGAPRCVTAGVKMLVSIDTLVEKGQPLFNIYADSKGELEYSKKLLEDIENIITIKDGK